MDKMQELHINAMKEYRMPWSGGEKHASITEDLIGKAMEWASKQKWAYHSSASIWVHPKYPRRTTSELIQLFKETL